MPALYNPILTIDPLDPISAHVCVEDLCFMVSHIQPPRLFIVSWDPDLELLAEGKINLMKGGQGTPMSIYDLYEGKDEDAVLERNGKRYTVRFLTWAPGQNLDHPTVDFHFEVEVEPILEA